MNSPSPAKASALSPDQLAIFAELMKSAGIAPAAPLVDRVAELMERGAVMVMAPGAARGPAVGSICPHTGLSYQEFWELRTKGWVLDGVEMLPPFEGWWTFNGGGSGRSVVHFSVPELLEYLANMQRICRDLRAQARVEAKATAAVGTGALGELATESTEKHKESSGELEERAA